MGIIIPTDKNMFQRGRSTTNQYKIYKRLLAWEILHVGQAL
jgi:hypothetical protein